jgi:hypothetical protein
LPSVVCAKLNALKVVVTERADEEILLTNLEQIRLLNHLENLVVVCETIGPHLGLTLQCRHLSRGMIPPHGLWKRSISCSEPMSSTPLKVCIVSLEV